VPQRSRGLWTVAPLPALCLNAFRDQLPTATVQVACDTLNMTLCLGPAYTLVGANLCREAAAEGTYDSCGIYAWDLSCPVRLTVFSVARICGAFLLGTCRGIKVVVENGASSGEKPRISGAAPGFNKGLKARHRRMTSAGVVKLWEMLATIRS
jgi:hypothetical protein